MTSKIGITRRIQPSINENTTARFVGIIWPSPSERLNISIMQSHHFSKYTPPHSNISEGFKLIPHHTLLSFNLTRLCPIVPVTYGFYCVNPSLTPTNSIVSRPQHLYPVLLYWWKSSAFVSVPRKSYHLCLFRTKIYSELFPARFTIVSFDEIIGTAYHTSKFISVYNVYYRIV